MLIYKYHGIRYTQYVSSLNGQWGWSCQTPPHPFYRSHSKRTGLPVVCSDVSHGALSHRLFFATSPVSCEIVFLFWLVFCPVSLSGLSPEPHCLTHCSLGTIMPLAHTSCPVSFFSMTFNLSATSLCRVRLCFLNLYSTACHIILTKTRFRPSGVVGYMVCYFCLTFKCLGVGVSMCIIVW